MKNKFYFLLIGILGVACSLKKDYKAPEVVSLTSPTTSKSAEPHLFTDGDGTVYLSWVEKMEDQTALKFSSLANDQWAAPSTIAYGKTWFVNWADYPMMVTNGNQFAAHFLDKSGQGTYAYDVKLTMSNNKGESWQEPFIIHDDKKQAEHGFVTVLPFGDNFFVTWLDGRNTVMEGMEGMEGMEDMDHEGHHGSMSLRAAVISNAGVKINEWELDNKTCDCCQTTAAITSSGPIVIYRDRSDEEIRDMSIVRLVNGQWTEPQAVHQDNWKIAGCPVNGPRADVEGSLLAVAWFSAATDTAHVNVIFSSDGGATFGKPVRVDEGKAIGRVDVVLIDESTAVVSWMEGTMIRAAKVNFDGTKEPSVLIASSSESRSSGFPQMTKSGNKLIFAWTDDKEKNIKVAGLSL